MDLEEIEPFLERENDRLLETLSGLAAENAALAQTVKLSEEVGELGTAVLEVEGLQRERECSAESDLAMELADVLITAMLLGDTLGVDIEAALERKMTRIESRYE